MQAIVYTLLVLGGFIISALGFWYQYRRPDQQRYRRFFDLAFGHDGSDGLPKQDSIFDQLQKLLARQDTQDKSLAHLIAEIPVNGVPLRTVIESIKEDQELIKSGMKLTDLNVATVRRKQARILRDVREAEARWASVLQAQGITTPEKRL